MHTARYSVLVEIVTVQCCADTEYNKFYQSKNHVTFLKLILNLKWWILILWFTLLRDAVVKCGVCCYSGRSDCLSNCPSHSCSACTVSKLLNVSSVFPVYASNIVPKFQRDHHNGDVKYRRLHEKIGDCPLICRSRTRYKMHMYQQSSTNCNCNCNCNWHYIAPL